MAETRYIVFEKRDGGHYDVLDQDVLASTPEQAMKIVAEKIAQQNGQAIESTVFAATPYRNWKQAPVGVEVYTRVKVG